MDSPYDSETVRRRIVELDKEARELRLRVRELHTEANDAMTNAEAKADLAAGLRQLLAADGVVLPDGSEVTV